MAGTLARGRAAALELVELSRGQTVNIPVALVSFGAVAAPVDFSAAIVGRSNTREEAFGALLVAPGGFSSGEADEASNKEDEGRLDHNGLI